MTDYKSLARQALIEAIKTRDELKISPGVPICIYDVAMKLGIETRFFDVNTLDGFYSKQPRPVIILGNKRPLGRQAYNCAHEIGHHRFNHGMRFDELTDDRKAKSPEEHLVDCFAGYFLMPDTAVVAAFKRRGFKLRKADPLEIYKIANYFEVGYETLVTHMTYALNLFSCDHYSSMVKISPKSIREQALGKVIGGELVFVDEHWTDRPIDLRIGDIISSPADTIHEGIGLLKIGETKDSTLFKADAPFPTTRLVNEKLNWSQFVRVMPRAFMGLAQYRHMENSEYANEDNSGE